MTTTKGKKNVNGYKNTRTPGRENINHTNSDGSGVTPSGASGSSILPSPPTTTLRHDVTSAVGVSSQLFHQINQLKRSTPPSPECKKWHENPWIKKLYLSLEAQAELIEAQAGLISKLRSECEANQEQQKELIKTSEFLHAVNSELQKEVLLLKSNETSKKQEEVLRKMENQLNDLHLKQTFSQDEADQQLLLSSVTVASVDLPDETPNENSVDIVCSLINTKLGNLINTRDIKAAYRVGKINPIGPSNRRIIIKLDNLAKKTELIKAAIEKKERVYINECLTKNRQTLHYRLRQVRKHNPGSIKQCFIRGGRIIVRKSVTGKTHEITNETQLTSFLNLCQVSEQLGPANDSPQY